MQLKLNCIRGVCAMNSGIGKLKTEKKKQKRRKCFRFECNCLSDKEMCEHRKKINQQQQHCINTIRLFFCRLLQFVSFFMCVCVFSIFFFIYLFCLLPNLLIDFVFLFSALFSVYFAYFFLVCFYLTSLKVVIMKFSLLNMCELFWIHVLCVCLCLCYFVFAYFFLFSVFFFKCFYSLCWCHKYRPLCSNGLWLYTIVYSTFAHNGLHSTHYYMYLISLLFFHSPILNFKFQFEKCIYNFVLQFHHHWLFSFHLLSLRRQFYFTSNYRWLLKKKNKFMSLKMIRTFHRKWYAIVRGCSFFVFTLKSMLFLCWVYVLSAIYAWRCPVFRFLFAFFLIVSLVSFITKEYLFFSLFKSFLFLSYI